MFWGIAPRLFIGFAMAAGILAPGGPYVNFPLVAVLYKNGAGIGPVASFLTAWGVVPLNRALVYEIPLLGTEFTIARYAASLVFPFVAGMVTPLIVKFIKLSSS